MGRLRIWWEERGRFSRGLVILVMVLLMIIPFSASRIYRGIKTWRAQQLFESYQQLTGNGERSAAVSKLQAAVTLAPDFYPAARQYGMLLIRIKHPDALIQWQYLSTLPESTYADQMTWVQLLLDNGEPSRAREVFDHLAAIESPYYYRTRAKLLEAEGSGEQAALFLADLVETRDLKDLKTLRLWHHLASRYTTKLIDSTLNDLAERSDAAGLFALRQKVRNAKSPKTTAETILRLSLHPLATQKEKALAEKIAEDSSQAEIENALTEVLASQTDHSDPESLFQLGKYLLTRGILDRFQIEIPTNTAAGHEKLGMLYAEFLLRMGRTKDLKAGLENGTIIIPPECRGLLECHILQTEGNQDAALRQLSGLIRNEGRKSDPALWLTVSRPEFANLRDLVLERLASREEYAPRVRIIQLIHALAQGDETEVLRLAPRIELSEMAAAPHLTGLLAYIQSIASSHTPETTLRILQEIAERTPGTWTHFVLALALTQSGRANEAREMLHNLNPNRSLHPRELLITLLIQKEQDVPTDPELVNQLMRYPLFDFEKAVLRSL